MKREYAIVDIETTGGNAAGSRITEIAILLHNGTHVTDSWQTLVNPEKEIPLPIFALTGINNQMVTDAPLFSDIAAKVFDLLSERIFVAHNVNFDYSFIRHQLEQCGYTLAVKKLCTVRAARKIKPGLHSYSLGNLCKELNIPHVNRHRAGGDATATVGLFSRLLQCDTNGVMDQMIKRASQDQRLPPNLPPADFEQLPEKPGVYYFYNERGIVVYIGKAINIKKRVASHFSGHKINSQRQNFLRDIHSISFEECATELMALLLECTEIKKLWPVYNTALKRFEPKYGLYCYEARSGFHYLAVGKLSKFQTCVEVFHSEYAGINTLRSLVNEFGIDHRFCVYGRASQHDGLPQVNTAALPDMDSHNGSVQNLIRSVSSKKPCFAIIDEGRTAHERSCIWVEEGCFYGMGYLPAEIGFTDTELLKDYITPYPSNYYIMQLLYSFAGKYPEKVFFQSSGKKTEVVL